MKVTLNNIQVLLQTNNQCLEAFLAEHIFNKLSSRQNFAVALNNHVIPTSNWCDTWLSDGDSVTVFGAIAGG